MDLKEIGKRIARQRKIKGYTQEELAEKTDLSVGYISGIESGNKVASLKNMLNIANVLELSLDLMLLSDISVDKIKRDSYIMEFQSMIDELEEKEKIERFINYAKAISEEIAKEK